MEKTKYICNKISKNYNSDYLDELSSTKVDKIILNIFKKISHEHAQKTTITELVNNYFKKPFKNPKAIAGLNMLKYYTNEKYGKKIYLVGEEHIFGYCEEYLINNTTGEITDLDIDDIMHIDEFIQQIFNHTTKFIDFFIEEHIFRHDIPEVDFNTGSLRQLSKTLHNCLNPLKRSKCKWKSIRTHFTDIRYTSNKKNEVISTNWITNVLMLKFDNKNTTWPRNDEDIRQLKLLKNIKTYDDIVTYIENYSLTIPRVAKEVKKIKYPKILLNAFRKAVKRRLLDLKILFKIKKINWDNLKSISGYVLTVILSFSMDLYTISRMFKTFKHPNDDIDQPTEVNNIIYYSGFSHTETIEFILQELNFKKVYDSYKESRSCILLEGKKINFKY
jgi:hypothetical protein